METTDDTVQSESLREIYGEKLIRFGTMTRLIRWVTALGIGQIILAVVLIGLTLAGLPKFAVHRPDGEVLFQVPVPVLVTCVSFMALAWTWLVVGALHARPVLRIPVLLLFLGLHGVQALNAGTVATLVFPVFWVGYALWRSFRPAAGFRRDIVTMGLSILLFYLFLIGSFGFGRLGGEYAATLISLQVMVVSFLLMPLFIFAGLDLGESARDVTRWLIEEAAVRSREQVLFWFAAGLCLVKVAVLIGMGLVDLTWLPAGLFLLIAAWVSLRAKPWLGTEQEPPVGLLLGGTLFSFLVLVALVVGIMLATGGEGSAAMAMFWTILLAGVAALVGALALSLRRTLTPAARTAAMFLGIFAAWVAVLALGGAPVWHGLLHLPGTGVVGLDSLDGAVAVLLLGLLFWLRRRGLVSSPLLVWSIALTVGLTAIRTMAWLVQNNWKVPAMTAAGQLVILGAGLLWDVLTSGQRWTNGESAGVPRQTRVLLYFGYVALTVTAVLFWKGSGQTGTFDEDTLALMGLNLIGVPLYLFGFARTGVLLVRQARERQAA
jgi:hypothetical protein